MAIERAYTMDETAGILRICRRMLQTLIAKYPYYHANGRRKLFTETQINQLRKAMERDAEEQRRALEASRASEARYNLSRRSNSFPAPQAAGSIWAEVQGQLKRSGADPKEIKKQRAKRP